jgi:hypothetical protein
MKKREEEEEEEEIERVEEMKKILSWSDLLNFAKCEIMSLRDLCSQRDDVFMRRHCDNALGKDVSQEKDDSGAIVDVAISNSYRIPQGFEKIETTIGGSKADLNEGMTGKSIFLCVRREDGKNVVNRNSFSTPLKSINRTRSGFDEISIHRESNGKFGFQFKGIQVVKLSMSCHATGLRIGHLIQSVNGTNVRSQEDINREFKKINKSDEIVKICVSRSNVLSSLTMRPITRLMPVFTGDGGFIPPGWFPVCYFPTGNESFFFLSFFLSHSLTLSLSFFLSFSLTNKHTHTHTHKSINPGDVADVNAGSGGGTYEVILCGERGGGSPVTDVKVIFGSSRNLTALRPLPKHRIIWRSLLGQPADLNHLMSRSRTTVFLALRQNHSWLSRRKKKDERLTLVTPLLLCVTENSPKFYRLACKSLTRLVMRGFFDPPGIGFVPSELSSSSSSSSSSSQHQSHKLREIRNEVSTLPAMDFVLGYLCENFPPTIDPTVRGKPSEHFVIRDFHDTMIKSFERDEAKYLCVETVFRAIWSLVKAIEFLVCEANASNAMMIRASEDGQTQAADKFKQRTNQARILIRESRNCMNRVAECIMHRFVNSNNISKKNKNNNRKKNDETRDTIVSSVLNDLTSQVCEGSTIEMLLTQLKRQGPIFGPNARDMCGIVCNAVNEISCDSETRHVIVLLVTLSRVAMETLRRDSESDLSSSARLASLRNKSFSSPLRSGISSPITGMGGNSFGGSSGSSGSINFNSTDSINFGNERIEDASQRNPSIMSFRSKDLILKTLIHVLSLNPAELSGCKSCLQIVRRFVCK